MKKQFIYAGMFLFTIGFSACNEDFKDWAAPQSNPQEDSAEQMTATFTTGQDANISMDDCKINFNYRCGRQYHNSQFFTIQR